ncbi:hypothetical protein ACI0FR_01696 [Paenochrobactrum sp. BZR 201-1]
MTTAMIPASKNSNENYFDNSYSSFSLAVQSKVKGETATYIALPEIIVFRLYRTRNKTG